MPSASSATRRLDISCIPRGGRRWHNKRQRHDDGCAAGRGDAVQATPLTADVKQRAWDTPASRHLRPPPTRASGNSGTSSPAANAYRGQPCITSPATAVRRANERKQEGVSQTPVRTPTKKEKRLLFRSPCNSIFISFFFF